MSQTLANTTEQGTQSQEALNSLQCGDFCTYAEDTGTITVLVTSDTPYLGNENLFFGGELNSDDNGLKLTTLKAYETVRIIKKEGNVGGVFTHSLIHQFYSNRGHRNYDGTDVI